jgi:predicted nucleic acid-binding protein
MITAIDTNILLDIFLPDPVFGEKSLSAVESAFEKGALVICNVVYAELVQGKSIVYQWFLRLLTNFWGV